MLGMHGLPAANAILDKADLVLALGVRFDDRAIVRVDEFCPGASIVVPPGCANRDMIGGSAGA